MNEGLGVFRQVGSRLVSEVYSLDTPEQRVWYFQKLQAMEQSLQAVRPIARVMAPGEPRVKRFRTLEEANADQLEGMIATMRYLNAKRSYPYG